MNCLRAMAMVTTQFVKLLIFAHKPPPHHGQSYMVELLLNAFGGDARNSAPDSRPSNPPAAVECYHVDCRFADGMADIGSIRVGKVFLLLKYCWQAIRCRFRFGVRDFFYIPAPPVRSAIYRDWLVMALCRPFFRRRIYYWQAAGLGEWLDSCARPWERWLTLALVGRPDLSVVLGAFCLGDAAALQSKRATVIPNGIPDPRPDFVESILPLRVERAAAFGASGPNPQRATNAESIPVTRRFQVLFLSLCTREKGLFDTIEAVALLNRHLAEARSSTRVQLTVAGKFWRAEEELEFTQRLAQPDLNGVTTDPDQQAVRYAGFVGGADKARLLRDSDCLCFPTFYQAESFGIVLIEAMAFGLPVVTTRWRTIPELLPDGYPGLVDPRSPAQIADALEKLWSEGYDPRLRARFLERFTAEKTFESLRAALLDVGNDLNTSPVRPD